MSQQQIMLVGNVGNEVEMRYTPTGQAVCNLNLAVNRRWNDASGNRVEKTTWFKAVCWRQSAEIAAQYVKKGQEVMILGEMEEPETWTGKDGTMRVTNLVTVRQLVLLQNGGRNGNGGGGQAPSAGQTAPPIDGEDIPF